MILNTAMTATMHVRTEGDTIVNMKIGARLNLWDRHSLYIGYGRPLTGEVWYKEIYRLEYRLTF